LLLNVRWLCFVNVSGIPISEVRKHLRHTRKQTSESKDTSNLLIQCGFGSEVRISDSVKNDADF